MVLRLAACSNGSESACRYRQTVEEENMRGRVIQVTRGDKNDQLLYFHSASFLKDGSGFVFIRTEGQSSNIMLHNLETGNEKALTRFKDKYMKSYIYYDGDPESGLGKASVTFDPESSLVYFLYGRKICSVDLEGDIREIAELPSGQITAYCAVSHDGSRLCVPTTDAEALQTTGIEDSRPFSIDRKIRISNLRSYLRIYEIRTGNLLDCQTVPGAWITHVAFSPVNADTILYNHEWAAYDMGIRRMWIWEGTRHIRLRKEAGMRTKRDFVCHEVWERKGDFIIYHGRYQNGSCFIGRVDPLGYNAAEIEFPPHFSREGHFTQGKNGFFVTDGFYENRQLPERIRLKINRTLKKEINFYGIYITLVKVDWENRRLEWIPLCRHGSDWSAQDSHPHPIINNLNNDIYFNSNRKGRNSIYRVEAPSRIWNR